MENNNIDKKKIIGICVLSISVFVCAIGFLSLIILFLLGMILEFFNENFIWMTMISLILCPFWLISCAIIINTIPKLANSNDNSRMVI